MDTTSQRDNLLNEAMTGVSTLSFSVQEDAITTETTVYIIIGIFGILGNGFVVLVILKSKSMKKELCNVLIIHQSAIDLLTSLFLVVNYPTVNDTAHLSGIQGQFYCRVWVTKLLFWCSISCSTYNLVAITFDRYASIVHPIWHKKVFNKRYLLFLVLAVWIFGIGHSLAFIIPTSGLQNGYCVNVGLWPSTSAQTAAGLIDIGCFYVLPIAFMVYSYTKIFLSFRAKVGDNLVTDVSQGDQQRTRKVMRMKTNVLKTFMLVAICYVLCWTWDKVLFLLFTMGYEVQLSSTLSNIGIYLAFLNSCINPIIYTAQYKQFQRAVHTLFLV